MSSRHKRPTTRPMPSRPSHPSARQRDKTANATPLPPYKKPSHPISAKAQQSLQGIYTARDAQSLKKLNDEAARLLTETAGAIIDRCREREDFVKKRRLKWDKGQRLGEKDQMESDLSAKQAKVEDMTKALEKGMRDVIDNKIAADRMAEALAELGNTAIVNMEREYETQMTQRQQQSQSQRRRRDPGSDEEMAEEDEGPTPGPTPLGRERVALTGLKDMFEDKMERKKDQYSSLSYATRYAQDNDYIGFKRLVHDAKHGESGLPLPRADTWFTENGPAPLGYTATQVDDEDDIVVDREKISTRCPLTLREFVEPYTSRICPHSFEKQEVLTMIRRSEKRSNNKKSIDCPVCSQPLTADDLYDDAVLIRKIRRMQKTRDEDFEDAEQGGVEVVSEDDDTGTGQWATPGSRPSTRPDSQIPPSSVGGMVDLGSEEED
ncbi:hypothetical protein M011DRAFT_413816 [Sporormia fimetaria CBS 119925]|uniref:SP-RING-type domain-containing protein n=1 Tax=Sporormia fimetaria CBS 119925 TaxID=1340428 RepID=A0A6A6UXI9_9PLEO|nr:hypothetical protein M011DRAFT_413816 [Sporormia fimetaria CBS 119925]